MPIKAKAFKPRFLKVSFYCTFQEKTIPQARKDQPPFKGLEPFARTKEARSALEHILAFSKLGHKTITVYDKGEDPLDHTATNIPNI